MNLQKVYRCQRNRLLRNLWRLLEKYEIFRRLLSGISKSAYVKLSYYMTFGEFLPPKNKLKSIDEKTHWLAAYWRNPMIVKCADKFRVREYVSQCGCGDILNVLYASYDDVKQIDFDMLPESFVIKANNGTGANIFCYNKNDIDLNFVVKIIESWKTQPVGVTNIEFQYSCIPFKIICERLLTPTDGQFVEYQLFCFNGIPESILVRTDLETKGSMPYAVTMSLDWERLYYRKNEDEFTIIPERPVFLKKMIDYALCLAKPFPQVRLDFYGVDSHLIFGEMTFSTHGNVYSNYKDEIRLKWGELLKLPQRYTNSDMY